MGKEYPAEEIEVDYPPTKYGLVPLLQLEDFLTKDSSQPQFIFSFTAGDERPFAGAPVRSRPHRTYDPARPWADPEGEYMATYLASVYHRDSDEWQILKRNLEAFGRWSGLFDEISVKPLGKSDGTPFQLQIRKFEQGPAQGTTAKLD